MGKYTAEDIMRMVEDENIRFIRLQFTDIFGSFKNIAITASQLEKALQNKCMFDGSSIEGFVRIDESDMYLWPDLDTYPAQQMEEELLALQEEPAVIIYKEHGELPEESAKWNALQLFLSEKEYILTYENDGYQVYTLPET